MPHSSSTLTDSDWLEDTFALLKRDAAVFVRFVFATGRRSATYENACNVRSHDASPAGTQPMLQRNGFSLERGYRRGLAKRENPHIVCASHVDTLSSRSRGCDLVYVFETRPLTKLYLGGRKAKRLFKQLAHRFPTGDDTWDFHDYPSEQALSAMSKHQPWNTIEGAVVTDAPAPPVVIVRRRPPPEQDAYQACRQWTIAVFQHISENEFSERLIGGSARYLGSAAYNCFNDNGKVNNTVNARQQTHRLSAMETIVWSRYLARRSGPYDVRTNAGVDVVFSTVANPAFYSALPSTVGLLDDNYKIIHEVCDTCRFH